MRFVGAVVAALLVLSGCANARPDGGSTPGPGPATSASPSAPSPLAALTVGTCTAAVSENGQPAESIATIDCTAAHYWEVAAVVPLTERDYPGEASLRTLASAACTRAFRSYVGVDVESSPYDATFVAPSESHWSNPDARELVCLVGSGIGGLKTSLKDHPVLFAETGQCLGQPASGSTSYPLAPCAEEHLYEVYASSKFAGSKAPTDAAIDKAYASVCVAGFKKFIGVELAKSKYEIQYFVLPSELWAKYPDHRLVCGAGSPSGGITGSLKDAKK